MFVRIRRLGGLAGFDEELSAIDTTRLPPPRAALVEQAVAALEGDQDATVGPGADFLRYELRVDHPDGRRAVLTVVDDGDLSRPALQRVKDLLG